MYKTLGLTFEEVCEIGKWKNSRDFSSHYLRLGAPQTAGRRLESFVHNVSSSEGAEPDKSRTPRSHGDLGGRDLEGEAPSLDEPALPPLDRIRRGVRKRLTSPIYQPLKFQFAVQRHHQQPSSQQ